MPEDILGILSDDKPSKSNVQTQEQAPDDEFYSMFPDLAPEKPANNLFATQPQAPAPKQKPLTVNSLTPDPLKVDKQTPFFDTDLVDSRPWSEKQQVIKQAEAENVTREEISKSMDSLDMNINNKSKELRIKLHDIEKDIFSKPPDDYLIDKQDQEYLDLASQNIRDIKRTLSAPQQGKAIGYFEGMDKALTNVDMNELVTLGFDKVFLGRGMRRIKEKLDAKQPLSESEEYLLQTTLLKKLADENTNPTTTYKMFSALPQNLPFLIQLATTGGTTSAISKGVQTGVKQGTKALIGRELGNITKNKALNYVENKIPGMIGSVAANSAVNVPTGSMFWENTVQNMTGNLSQDENGNYAFSDSQPLLKAVWESYKMALPEYYFEGIGSPTKAMIQDLGKYAAKRFKTMIPTGQLTGLGKHLTKAAKFDGLPTELLEEELTGISQAIMSDQMTLGEFFSSQNQKDLFFATLSMSLGFGMAQAPGKVMDFTRYLESKSHFETNTPTDIKNQVYTSLQIQDYNNRWDSLRNIDYSNTTPEQQAIIFDYVRNKTYKDLYTGWMADDVAEETKPIRNVVTGNIHPIEHRLIQNEDGTPMQFFVIDNIDSNTVVVSDLDGKRQVVSLKDADILPEIDINQYSVQQATETLNAQEETEVAAQVNDQNQQQAAQFQPGQSIVYNNQQFSVSEILPDGSIVADDITGDGESVMIPPQEVINITTPEQQAPVLPGQEQAAPEQVEPEQQANTSFPITIGNKPAGNAVQNTDGTFTIDQVYQTPKEAEKVKKGLLDIMEDEGYTEANFQITSAKIDPNNPFSPKQYKVHIIPPVADLAGQETVNEQSEMAVQAPETGDVLGIDQVPDVGNMIEEIPGTDNAGEPAPADVEQSNVVTDGEEQAQGQTETQEGVLGQKNTNDNTQVPQTSGENGEPVLFKNSKVIDNNGKLKVVYHGTKGDFNEFKLLTDNKRDFGALGDGIYFTEQLENAENYARGAEGNGTPKVKKAYLNIEKPYIWRNPINSLNLPDAKKAMKIKQDLIRKGYDGIFYETGYGYDWYVVFDPKQIKIIEESQQDKNPGELLTNYAINSEIKAEENKVDTEPTEAQKEIEPLEKNSGELLSAPVTNEATKQETPENKEVKPTESKKVTFKFYDGSIQRGEITGEEGDKIRIKGENGLNYKVPRSYIVADSLFDQQENDQELEPVAEVVPEVKLVEKNPGALLTQTKVEKETKANITEELNKEAKVKPEAILLEQKKRLIDDLITIEDVLLETNKDETRTKEKEMMSDKAVKRTDIDNYIESNYQFDIKNLPREIESQIKDLGFDYKDGMFVIDVFKDGTVEAGSIRTALKAVEDHYPTSMPNKDKTTPFRYSNAKVNAKKEAENLKSLADAETRLKVAQDNLAEAEKSPNEGLKQVMRQQLADAQAIYEEATKIDYAKKSEDSTSSEVKTPEKKQPKQENSAKPKDKNPGELLTEKKDQEVVSETEITKEATSKAEKIDDFGEKIEGAKKDIRSKLEKQLGQSDDDILTQGFAKAFPIIDYKGLVESGMATPEEAALLHWYRNEVKARPQLRHKLKRWLDTVRTYENVLRWITNKEEFTQLPSAKSKTLLEVMEEKLGKYAWEEINNYSRTLIDLGFPNETFNFGNYSIKRFSGSSKYTIVNGRYIIKDFDKWEEAIAGLKFILTTQKEKPNKVEFDMWSMRGDKEKTITVGKKIAAGKYITLATGFKTVKEAQEYIKGHQEELEKALQDRKTIPNERPEANTPRVGKDYRNGKDVTPEQFSETFGFRGVQFGNYVENKHRQEDLNNSYDALMDLAEMTGLPPKALSLNGELGMAFGARGSGGINAPMAHYEPGQIVINLTKENGPGTLAHEWFHAMDNYFSRARNSKLGYITDRPYSLMKPDGSTDTSVRPEVLEAFNKVVKAIRKSDLPKRAEKLDLTRTKDYWGTTIELAARSFEAYAKIKLEEKGIKNDYLVAFKDIVDYIVRSGSEDAYPYPTAEEMKGIGEAFENLFNTIETKQEGDKTVLYKKSLPSIDFSTPSIKKETLQDFYNELGHGGKVNVLSSNKDILDDYLSKKGASESFIDLLKNDGEFVGAYIADVNEIYIKPNGILSQAGAESVWIHENVHFAARNFLGSEIREKLGKKIFDSLIPLQLETTLGEDYINEDEEVQGDEYLATRAESNFLRDKINQDDVYSKDEIVGLLSKDKLETSEIDKIINTLANYIFNYGTAERQQNVNTLSGRSSRDGEDVGRGTGIVQENQEGREPSERGSIPEDVKTDERQQVEPPSFKRRPPVGNLLNPNQPSQIIKRGSLAWWREGVQDNMLAVRKLQSDYGLKVDDISDIYNADNQKNSRSMGQEEKFQKDFFRPFLEIAAKLPGKKLDDGSYLKLDKQLRQGNITVAEWEEKKKELDSSNVLRYMIAKHAPERNKYFIDQGRKGDNFAGMTDQEAAEIVRNFEVDLTKSQIDEFWNAWRKATNEVMDMWVRYGRYDAKTLADIQKRGWQYYVPLRGWEPTADDIDWDYQTNSGKNGSSFAGNQQAKGRTSIADNPLASLENMAQSAILWGEKNRVKQAALRLVKNNKSRNELFYMKSVWNMKDSDGKVTEVIKEGDNFYSFDGWDNDGNMITSLIGTVDDIEANGGSVSHTFNSEHQAKRSKMLAGQHELEVYLQGRKYVVVFRDPNIANEINKIGVLGPIPIIAPITRFKSKVVTSLNPVFVMKNMIRDFLGAGKTLFIEKDLKTSLQFAQNYGKAIHYVGRNMSGNESNQWNQYWKEFTQMGGRTGSTHLDSLDTIKSNLKKEISRIKRSTAKKALLNTVNVFKHLDTMAQYSENVARFAAYVTARKKGMSMVQSIREAKEITVNFDRKGKWSGAIGSFVQFFNASTQGAMKQLTMAKNNPVKYFMATATTLAAQGYLLSMLYDLFNEPDDKKKDYKAPNKYTRYNNAIIGFRDTYLAIPLAQGYRMWNALGCIIYDLQRGKTDGEQAAFDIAESFLGSLSPVDATKFLNKDGEIDWILISGKIISPVEPLIQAAINEDYKGDPVRKVMFTKEQEENIPESQQYLRNTNPAIIAITDGLFRLAGGDPEFKSIYKDDGERVAGAMDINPATYEYLIKQYTGGVGTTVLNGITAIAQATMDEQEKTDIRKKSTENSLIYDWGVAPVINGFYRSKYQSAANEEFKKLDRWFAAVDYNRSQAKKDNDWDRMLKYGTSEDNLKYYDLKYSKKLLDDLYDLRKKVQTIDQINMIDVQITQIKRNLVIKYLHP